MSASRTGSAALLLTLASLHTASAAEIQPGGRPQGYADQDEYWRDVSIEWLDDDWRGEVLASETTPFEIRRFSKEAGRDVWVTGQLTHEVIREAETGYLSFHYRVGVGGGSPDTRDFEGITAHGFGRYMTDVWANVGHSELPTLFREADGNSIWYIAGEGFGHWLIVRTDAPAFAPGGSFHYAVDWDAWGEAGTAVVPTFRAVPEPAAGMLLSVAAPLLLRRRRPAVAPPPAAGR